MLQYSVRDDRAYPAIVDIWSRNSVFIVGSGMESVELCSLFEID